MESGSKVTKTIGAAFMNLKQLTVRLFQRVTIIKVMRRAVIRYLVNKIIHSVNYLYTCSCASDASLRFPKNKSSSNGRS
jgi:hypothetical protein